eukprot:m.881373 g.881373  ORF g.881373 m.881373 type:complete len:476 (+) comp59862_c0_seq2:4249-5676(+)
MLRHLLGKDTFLRFLKSPETSLSIAARSPQSTKTPVMYAVEGGHLECFEALLDVGADLSATGGTLLHLAALHNHPAMLQRLLSLPQLACKLNDRDSSGVAPLGAAVQGGSVECLQMLQKAGADIRTAVSPVVGSLLCLAAAHGRAAMLVHLLSLHLFDDLLNATDRLGNTALMCAVQAGSIECYQALRSAGAVSGIRTSDRQTFLHMAAALDDPIFLDFLLLESNVHLNSQDRVGSTPLMHACGLNNLEGVQRLVDAGADISICGPDGQTVLHRMAAACAMPVLEILVKACTVADLNAQDKKGNTALAISVLPSTVRSVRFASRLGQLSPHHVIRLLLDNGADPRIHNTDGRTAKDEAAKSKLTGIVKMLQAHEEYVANVGSQTKAALHTPVHCSPANTDTHSQPNLLEQENSEPGPTDSTEGLQEPFDPHSSASETTAVEGQTEASKNSTAAALNIDLSDLQAELDSIASSAES